MEGPGYQPTDRRPIASRDRRWAHTFANALARTGVRANTISLAGMFAALLGGVALAATTFAPDWARLLWLAAAICMQCRLLANLFDGMVAIASAQASPVGELYNEVPDRVSDAAFLIGAGYALGGSDVLGWAATCLALFTAYVRVMGKVAGAPQEYCGPMAKQHRMFVLTITCVYLCIAPASWQPHWGLADSWGLIAAALALIAAGSALTAMRRLVRIGRFLTGRTRTTVPAAPAIQPTSTANQEADV